MNTVQAMTRFFQNHTTKLLGFLQITVGAIASVDGVFAPKTVKILMMVSGVLTAWRGFASTAAISKSKE